MQLTKEIAKQVRGIYFGGNWTASSLKEHLSNVTWKQATTEIYNLNTIATLAHHINYYTCRVNEFLEGNPFAAKDSLSFTHPPITSEKEWQNFLDNLWDDGERFAKSIEQLADDKLGAIFLEEKYGHYYYNFSGILEHAYYHLGQIVLIKKILVHK